MYLLDLSPSTDAVLKACSSLQGMPLKATSRKPKRAVLRGAGKDLGKNKIDCQLLLQKHEEARERIALAHEGTASVAGICLVPSPRALVLQLQRSFALEFPLLAHRAHFVLDPE